MSDWLDLLQWPAMVITVLAGLLVGSRSPLRVTNVRGILKTNKEHDEFHLPSAPAAQRRIPAI
jgi:hypothetical protein